MFIKTTVDIIFNPVDEYEESVEFEKNNPDFRKLSGGTTCVLYEKQTVNDYISEKNLAKMKNNERNECSPEM